MQCNLGFWPALREEYPSTLAQRCGVNKTANILDKRPKTLQPEAKGLLQQVYLSATKSAALEAYDQFINRYATKYPAAWECLVKDQEGLFTFYEFPPNTGGIFAPPTRSNRPSLPCATAPNRPRAVAPDGPP